MAAFLVALDTQALIWGIKEQCSPSQEDMIRRAKLLLRQLDRDKAQVLLPTVAFAELMAPLNVRERAEFAARVEEKFLLVPFDTRAAHLAAALWQHHRKLAPADRSVRSLLKSDSLIIASAYAAGARVFFSHDRRCRKLAEGLPELQARDLPSHSDELEFPE